MSSNCCGGTGIQDREKAQNQNSAQIHRGDIVNNIRWDPSLERVGFQSPLKFILVGPSGCGKTSICASWMGEKFDANRSSTIGVDFISRYLNVNGEDVQVRLWDTAGQEKYLAVVKSLYRGSHVVYLVYDMTKEGGLQGLEKYLDPVMDQCPNAWKILVGSKSDMKDFRTVSQAEGREFMTKHQLDGFIEVSGKNNENIEEMVMMALKDRNNIVIHRLEPAGKL